MLLLCRAIDSYLTFVSGTTNVFVAVQLVLYQTQLYERFAYSNSSTVYQGEISIHASVVAHNFLNQWIYILAFFKFYLFIYFFPLVDDTALLNAILASLNDIATSLNNQITTISNQQKYYNQLSSYRCWLNFILARATTISGYLTDGTLPDPATLGDFNFCIFMNQRNEKVKLQVIATGNCHEDSGIAHRFHYIWLFPTYLHNILTVNNGTRSSCPVVSENHNNNDNDSTSTTLLLPAAELVGYLTETNEEEAPSSSSSSSLSLSSLYRSVFATNYSFTFSSK
jgi:hypothetical protein